MKHLPSDCATVTLDEGEKGKANNPQTAIDSAATEQGEVNQIEANTSVIMWAVASFVSMLFSGASGIYLLETVGVTGVPPWTNILVTGLAVGAGTKPLHELINKLEKPSEEGESSDEDSGG